MTDLLIPSDNRLNLRSREITSDELRLGAISNTLANMRQIAVGERDEAHPEKRSMVGLAAPQIGELVRIILIDVAADPLAPNFTPNLKFFVNPCIVEASVKENLGREGCYSTGEICGAVFRSNDVTVSALDENGEQFEHSSANPFQARILQHEIDHLDGIRFPSRVRSLEHLHRVAFDEFQIYRDDWMNWKKLYPIEDWLKIERGE